MLNKNIMTQFFDDYSNVVKEVKEKFPICPKCGGDAFLSTVEKDIFGKNKHYTKCLFCGYEKHNTTIKNV